jgi:NADPH oxidase
MGITSWQTGLVLFWWIICNFGIFMIGYLEQQNDPGLSQLNDPIGNSIFFSRGAGLALMLQAMLIFLPVCRNILALLRQVKWMRKVITFDKNIHFHKVIAWTMLIFTAVHSFAHLVNFYWVERLKMTILKKNNSALFLLWNHPAGYTGVILLSIMFLMYTSSLHPIRRQCFELFWYIHHLAFPFMVTLCLHPIGCFVKRRDGNCKPYGTW